MRLIAALLPLCFHGGASAPLVAELAHGGFMPLVGLGVGNLQPDRIPQVVEEAVRDLRIRYIDTAAKSRNERMIADAVSRAGLAPGDVVILTKVWYTHLGYERTMRSVKDSLEQLGEHARNVTILIHWPRCQKDVPWMHCEEEEASLPADVKELGPPPHLNPDAWLESWRALEDLHREGKVATIGVSNCDEGDLEALAKRATIAPHLLQGNVWSFAFNSQLRDYLRQHRITFQAYNVMNGVVSQKGRSPAAFKALEQLAAELGGVAPSAVVLRWLVDQGVSVIPRASSANHLRDNSPDSIAAVPELTQAQREMVANAVQALLKGEGEKDKGEAPNHVEVRFRHQKGEPASIFFVRDTGEEVPVVDAINPGESKSLGSYPGHTFLAKGLETGRVLGKFEVTAEKGSSQDFLIGGSEEL